MRLSQFQFQMQCSLGKHFVCLKVLKQFKWDLIETLATFCLCIVPKDQKKHFYQKLKQNHADIFTSIFQRISINLSMDNLHIGQLSCHFFFWQATILRLTQITPWGWIFGPRIFII